MTTSDNRKSPLYDLIAARKDPDAPASELLGRALEAMRTHLGMDVAYVSEFVGDRSVFREVRAPGHEDRLKPGDSLPLDDVYCRHVLEGRLPELIPDTSQVPLAASLPITKAASINSHVSVPIRLSDGEPYGMFCCVGFQANPTLQQRDLQMMRAFADLAAFEINREIDGKKAAEAVAERVRGTIDDRSFSVVYQPIWDVRTGRPVGLECLTRFSALPSRTPDLWFKEAASAGLGTELELVAMHTALGALSSGLPASCYLAVNASPATIETDDFKAMFKSVDLSRIVLEVTEHAHVESYEALLEALEPLRSNGLRVAVDDAGAGYSGLCHILRLHPDIIKLDMALTRHIDLDPARQALASALIGFAEKTDSRIVAEGVETESELKTLGLLGATYAQGYLLGRPMPLDRAVLLFGSKRSVAAA
jgi:EAL domain-containing protein (putative c-di-GMP-specific phosphodiesterase class I)